MTEQPDDQYIDLTLRLPMTTVALVQRIARMTGVGENEVASVIAALAFDKLAPESYLRALENLPPEGTTDEH